MSPADAGARAHQGEVMKINTNNRGEACANAGGAHLRTTLRAATALGTALSMVLVSAGLVFAAGPGGGGGGTLPGPTIAGTWNGEISFPAPPQLILATMTLAQDAAGNLTGQLCTQFCAPATGRILSDGSFEIRGEGYDMKGGIFATATCSSGKVVNWISGGVQQRGGTGSFSFTQCP
jgi:hypothetical protein